MDADIKVKIEELSELFKIWHKLEARRYETSSANAKMLYLQVENEIDKLIIALSQDLVTIYNRNENND